MNIGNATATGDLDKNIIRRYIRQKLPQIQHCYEKQLVVTLIPDSGERYLSKLNKEWLAARDLL